MEPIRIEFEHRLSDHLRASRLFHAKASALARVDKVVAVILALFGLVLVIAVGPRWWTLVWFVLAPLEWFDLLSIEPVMVRLAFRKTSKFCEPTTLVFTEDAVQYKTPSVDSTLRWDVFRGILEDADLFLLLYRAPRPYAVIPKRAFADAARIDEFRDLAGRKLGLRPSATE